MLYQDTFYLGILSLFVAAAVFLEYSRYARYVPPALFMLLSGVLLANLPVNIVQAKVSGAFVTHLLPVGMALLLFHSNVMTIFKQARILIVPFFVAIAATLTGVVVAFLVLPGFADKAAMAGVVTATLVGGSMNFLAVSETLQYSQSPYYGVTLAADVAVGTTYFAFLIAAASIASLRRLVPSRIMDQAEIGEETNLHSPALNDNTLPPVLSLVTAMTIALLIAAAGQYVAGLLALDAYTLLFVTAFAVLFATLADKLVQRISGEEILAMIIMYIFFFIIGSGVDLESLLEGSQFAMLFYLIVISLHFLVLFGVAYLFKLDFASILIASNACVLGPPTAAAVAAANHWRSLVTPGLLIGILGYALANFIGVSAAGLLASF